jgi:hypothetical protein
MENQSLFQNWTKPKDVELALPEKTPEEESISGYEAFEPYRGSRELVYGLSGSGKPWALVKGCD